MTPRILIFDIETSPIKGFAWTKYDATIFKIEEDWFMLSFSAKWLGGSFENKALCDYEGYSRHKHNDKELVQDMWKLFDQADILVAHNGDKFDIKKVNARFSYWGLTPPSPYKTVDTLKIARQHFGFTSNSLKDLALHLELDQKMDTGGKDLWFDCMNGDMEAWKKMKKYNKQDVVVLEEIYKRFLPYMKHPNLNLWAEEMVDRLRFWGNYRQNLEL